MLFQNDPFRDFDSWFTRPLGRGVISPPLDAYRRDTDVWVHIDLPGVRPDSLPHLPHVVEWILTEVEIGCLVASATAELEVPNTCRRGCLHCRKEIL